MTNTNDTNLNDGPLPGLLRPPIVLLSAILLGVALNLVWPLSFVPSALAVAGPVMVFAAVIIFALSLREFRAAGTSVRGTKRTASIVHTGPYRFSRNPIYLSFVLLMLGLAIWLNNFWLLVTLVPFVGFVAIMVIPREEAFLERNFHTHYSDYKATVRRWL